VLKRFEQLSSSIDWWVMVLRSDASQEKWLTQNLKGMFQLYRCWHVGCQVTIYSYFEISLKSSSFACLSNNIAPWPIAPESCFIPSKDSASLQVSNEKNFFGFGFHLFCEWPHKWGMFLTILASVTWPRAQLLRSILLKFSLETGLESWVFWDFDRLSSVSGSKAMI